MTEISITLLGDDLFRYKIEEMGVRANHMGPVLREIADDWNNIIEETFASEGRRVQGRPWAPLARETVLRRGSSHPILVETAEMLVELTGPETIKVKNDEIVMEVPASVATRALAHQHGFYNQRAGREVPARPWAGFNALDRRVFATKITDYLVNGNT